MYNIVPIDCLDIGLGFFSKCINVHRLLVKDDDIELGEEKEERMLQIKERDQCIIHEEGIHRTCRLLHLNIIRPGFFQNASLCRGS